MSRTIIVRKARTMLGALLVLVAAILPATLLSGCTFAKADLYKRDGLTIAIPKEYAGQLLIDPVEGDDQSILISIYHRPAYEKYPGMGLLFSIVRYTEAQYEQSLSADGSGLSFFAKDDKYYYGFVFPTDVQSPDDHAAYAGLFSSLGDFIRNDFVQRNRLTAYDDEEFFGRTFTYDSEHVFIKYYPYYSVNGSKEEVWTLYLSQPVKQGDEGIWCVERWRDNIGNVYVYFPDGDGVPSREYYAALQAEADAARQDPQFVPETSLFDPGFVALEFVKVVFGHTPNAGSFERADGSGTTENLFAGSTGNIHDYLPGLIAGEKISAYDLLPCLENFTVGTWAELQRAYGSEWWEPFWNALRAAALSDMPADPDDQVMRNYYLGKLLLASDGAYAEMASELVLLQWKHHSRLYSGALKQFTADEAALLRFCLSNLVSYKEDTFYLGISEGGSQYLMSLNSYPTGFPFGTKLTETSHENFHAEGLGQVTLIESGGLQLKYLDEAEGVYYLYCIRTGREGCFTNGVAVGDHEEKLWDHWTPGQLRKLDQISHDDEGWFGADYDYGYVYVPEGSTKSIMYLIKDGRVTGISLVDGLFGPMY